MDMPDNVWIITNLKSQINDNKKFYKALQIIKYLDEIPQLRLRESTKQYCTTLAFIHTLIEDDKDFSIEDIPCNNINFKKSLYVLTPVVGESDEHYCATIKKAKEFPYGECAYYVILAKIKYHLLNKEMTDSEKVKYAKILIMLL